MIAEFAFQKAYKRSLGASLPKRVTDLDRLLKMSMICAVTKMKNPSQKDVYRGLCSYTHWRNGILSKPEKMRYLTDFEVHRVKNMYLLKVEL